MHKSILRNKASMSADELARVQSRENLDFSFAMNTRVEKAQIYDKEIDYRLT